MEGYVRNPWSKEHDGMHVKSLIRKVEKEAARVSGCHYEIYEMRCTEGLLSVIGKLNSSDTAVLLQEASSQGYELDADSVAKKKREYQDFIDELNRYCM